MNLIKYIQKWEKGKHFEKYYHQKNHQIRFKKIALACRGNTILDVGCGLGHSTFLMSEHRPGDWYGVDFYPDVEQRCNKYFPDTNFYYSPDFNLLKNIGSKFNTVICSEVLDVVIDDRLLLEQLISMATQKIIITIPTSFNNFAQKRSYNHNEVQALVKDLPGVIKIDIGGGFWYIDIVKGGIL